ncbi:hypothetical protein ACFS5J_02360 [Flavobacterium chuncheonense]|uniref:Uncharacterized protein n=1 Tax=Flavobacterium chuncheonense TaxID=2026653 RepID=A0ABW5YIL2_9FLAO
MIDLHTKTNQLNKELYKNFIFYIPSYLMLEMYNINQLSNEQYEMFEPYLDKVSYTDDNDWQIHKTVPFNKDYLLEKTYRLRSNILSIFELKESLKPETFQYIFEKYHEQISVHKTITALLVEHYDSNCPEKSEDLKNLFLSQQNILATHYNEIEKHFKIKPNTEKFNSQELIEKLKNLNTPITSNKKYLRDYILHPNKIEIERIILNLYSERNGTSIRYLIECMEEIKLITLEHGKRKLIHEAMQNSFNGQLPSYKAVFGYTIDKIQNTDYKNVKLELNKSLNQYI